MNALIAAVAAAARHYFLCLVLAVGPSNDRNERGQERAQQ
jgi:hypothetical protein